MAIVPGEMADRRGKYAVFLVSALHGAGEPVDDIEVGTAVGNRLDSAVAPLRPAPAVDDAPLFLDPDVAGQNEHFGGNSLGSAPGGFQKPAVSCSNKSATTIHSSLSSPARIRRALAPPTAGFWPKQNSPFTFAGEHRVGEREKCIALSLKSPAELRQVSEVEVIFAAWRARPTTL